MVKLIDILYEIIEGKEDRCLRIARRKYDKPSAYRSGAIVRCRRGDIWKDLKEENQTEKMNIQDLAYKKMPGLLQKGIEAELDFLSDIMGETLEGTKSITNPKIERVSLTTIKPSQEGEDYRNLSSETEAEEFEKIVSGEENVEDHRKEDFYPILVSRSTNRIIDGNHKHYALSAIDSPYAVVLYVDVPKEYLREKKESLHTWFNRKGGAGKAKGWVDCNTCREVDGKKKCKPCGRQEGEKRSKYPSCRPTPSQCSRPGKGKTWGKTK